jgi:hypothetical protein
MPLVWEMLGKLPPETWTDQTKTFLEPSCGHGNFLLGILVMKLSHGHPPTVALSTIFAVDIMEDNVIEARERLLWLLEEHTGEKRKPEWIEIVKRNVIVADGLQPKTWPFMTGA